MNAVCLRHPKWRSLQTDDRQLLIVPRVLRICVQCPVDLILWDRTQHVEILNIRRSLYVILTHPLHQFVGAGQVHPAVAFAHEFAAPFVEAGRLRAIRPDLFAYAAPFQAAWSPERERQPVVRAFLGAVRRTFGVGPGARRRPVTAA